MKKTFFVVITLAVSAAAMAQPYKWVDQNGRVQYGDAPPAGVNATPLRSVPGPANQPAPQATEAKTEAKKGPLTPAEQEAEYRKRQLEAQKEQEKQAQATQQAAAKKENCARAQDSLRTFESGQRIVRTDAKGERHYLDDAQIAQETSKARQSVQQWCN
jgi:hypothetical protein